MMRALRVVIAVACLALLADTGIARAPVPRDLPTPAGTERTLPITKDIGITFCWSPSGEGQLGSEKAEQTVFEESLVRVLIASGEKPQMARPLVAEIDPSG